MKKNHSNHLEIFFSHLDFLAEAPERYRRTAFFRKFSVVITPSYVFVISGSEQYAFVDLARAKKHILNNLE